MKTTAQTRSPDIPSYVFQKSFFGREIQEQAEQTSKDKRVYYIFFLVERHFCTSPVQSLQKVGCANLRQVDVVLKWLF